MATIAITGASGFIGSALTLALRARGDRVRPFVRAVSARAPEGALRRRDAGDAIAWDPEAGTLDAGALEGVDAVVHLAGESIVGARWSDAQKARIRESRVRGTSLLADALRDLKRKPEVLLSGSAVGIYGDRGDTPLSEASNLGDDFLAEVGKVWEAAAQPAAQAGIRLVHPRTGIVLGAGGGALAKMLTPFKLGVGGKLGSGQQYMSWIALSDTVRGLLFMLDERELRGPVNLTAPTPVTNADFTRALGQALKRPSVLPIPGFAARLAFGEMAEVALLHGQRVLPERLLAAGFRFEQPALAPYLRELLR